MNISDFRVEPADYRADLDDIQAMREAVLVVAGNANDQTELDTVDPDCFHFIARDNHHQAIGTARLAPNKAIGQMAVLETWRKKGVGKALLLALIDKARQLAWTEVILNSPPDAIGFYEKFGFVKAGNTITESRTPKQPMRMALDPANKPERPAPKPRDALVEITEVKTLEDTQSALIQLISKARRQICIYSPDLEPVLYGNAEIVEALKQFAINSGGGNVLIIVQDTMAVRSQPHPLIDLAQRLPSAFLLRTPVEADDLQYPSAYLINDRDGYLFRQRSSHYIGVWSPTMPSRNRQLTEEFDRVWQRCRTCTEFRALGL
jgi:predicted GNAT family N-acyltransferase